MKARRFFIPIGVFSATLAFLILSLIPAQQPAMAISFPYTLSGTVDGSDPVFDTNKVLLNCTGVYAGGSNWHYELRTMTVDKSISLNIFDLHNSDGMDVMYGVYDVTSTPFNASNLPLTSQCLGAATNNLDVSLSPGHTYVMAIANFNSTAGGNYEVQLNPSDTSVNLIIGSPGGGAPVAPTITNLSASVADGTYGPGVTMNVVVTFSAPVEYSSIGSYMTLTLNSGGSAICTYCNAYPTPLSSTYNFTYTVSSGQSSSDLDVSSITALALNGGTLRDGSGTDANTTLPTPGAAGSLSANKNIVILTPTLSINDVTVTEGNAGTTTATFTVSLSNSMTAPTITTDFATADGTATAGSDYVANSGTLTFNPGVTSQTLNVTVNGDTLNETNETYFVNLSNVSGADYADSQGLGTITNDDPAPSLSINDVTVTEGNAGTTTATFTVSLSAASGQTVTVDYATADGTATTAGSDYVAVSGTLTFNPGTTTQTVNVTVNGDTLNEVNETYFVNLTNPVSATITDNQGLGTITDDDPVPSLSINDVTMTEGNAGTTTATFTVSLSAASGQTVTVDYSTADSSATTAGSDYVAASGTLTFTSGITTQSVNVTVNGDLALESDETFFVNLTNPVNATITDNQGLGTISNDDVIPDMSINDVTLAEGNSGSTTFTFTVSLTAASNQTITVDYATADGTATTANGDYVATSGTLTFTTGIASQTVDVTVDGDSLNEVDETFFVNLTNATNANMVDNQGLGTITNDDAAPGLSINDVSIAEGNSGTSTANFTVSLSGASGLTVTVDYATADGTATTADNDYAANSGTLTFNPGVTTQTASVTINGDTLFEGSETFAVNLSNATNSTISDAQGIGTITNDDGQPTFTINDLALAEGNSGITIFSFTVTRSGNTNNVDTVDYATSDDTATTADNDYAATSGTLTFGVGITTQTISVDVNGDVIAEGDETFKVTLSNASAPAVIGDAEGVGTIQNDEPAPGVSVDDISVAENGVGGQFTVTLYPVNSISVSVDYMITDGTAVLATDYDAVVIAGNLSFAPGETTKTIPFTIVDNSLVDGNRTFTVTLSNIVGSAITKAIGTATIIDNEVVPSVAIELPAPPPATECNDVNFEDPGIVRTHFTNDADLGAINCRVIAGDGHYMTWYGSPLTNSGNIGNQTVLDLGVIAAVDVFSPNGTTGFVGDVDICLKGSGYMIYLGANNSPRVPQLWSTWTTDAFPGYTCTTLYAPGTVVLVQKKP